MTDRTAYKRVLLKVSGESLCSPGGGGIQADALADVAGQIADIAKTGVQLGVVTGGGNLIRGRDLAHVTDVQPATAHQMGMLATLANALALRDALTAAGLRARAMSAIPVGGVCETFSRWRAIELIEKGRVVVFGGGTGSPFVTTDMCAAIRAREIDAEVVLKATKVDGVFDSDPNENPNAKKYDRLTYAKVLADRLGVMDLAAVGMCMEQKIPVLVFQLSSPGALAGAVRGENVGTLISD